jgi:hypothetical protein
MFNWLLLIVVLILIWRNGCCIKKRIAGIVCDCPNCNTTINGFEYGSSDKTFAGIEGITHIDRPRHYTNR